MAGPMIFPPLTASSGTSLLAGRFGDYAIEVAYVGNKANKLMANRNINQPTPGPGSVNSRRIFPGWGSITFQEPRGNSMYHGLQTKLEKRFSLGHLFLVSYTWAKAIDDSDSTQLSTTSGTGNLQDQFNLRAERSRSFQDVRHRLVVSYLWELPIGRGRCVGWKRVSGVEPARRRLADQRHHFVPEWARLHRQFVRSITPTPDLQISGRTRRASHPTSLPRNAPCSGGSTPQLSASRMVLHSGTQVEMSGQVRRSRTSTFPLFKDIPFDAEGKRKLQFRSEFFNIMNTPQFQIPNRTFNTPQFGTITETVADNRDVQLALRFIW